MSHVSCTKLRAHLAVYMDEVCDSGAALLVTRRNARSVVMISEDEYESIMETLLASQPGECSTLAALHRECKCRRVS